MNGKINRNEGNGCYLEYFNRLIKKYVYKKREAEEKRKKVGNIIRNMTLLKSNVLPSFCGGCMQDFLDDFGIS